MAELRQARGIGRRPVVVAVLLLSSSLIGAALPNPAEPTTLRGVDQVSFPTAPAIRAATPPAYAPDRKAPIVDIIPGRMAPSRVVVEVPKAEPQIVLGPGGLHSGLPRGLVHVGLGWRGPGPRRAGHVSSARRGVGGRSTSRSRGRGSAILAGRTSRSPRACRSPRSRGIRTWSCSPEATTTRGGPLRPRHGRPTT